ncbi:MAG: transport-associated protein [Myxococcaceae bacterium]|nr:transport-associated protein [Myxococcaceae bacterium]
MPNREHEDSYYDRAHVRTDRSYGPTNARSSDWERQSYERDRRPQTTQHGYPEPRPPSRFAPQTQRSQGYSQADFDRAQAAYAPEWRSYAQDWRDSPQPQSTGRTWARAEGYAQQRTERGHQHESVFGEQESIRQDWDRNLGRNWGHSRSDYPSRVQFAPHHDEETLGQQLRHAGHAVVNSVKRAFRGPKGYKRSDERIREDVNDRLAQQDQLDPSEIEVKVEAGEVTLTGSVHSRWDKFAAEEIADAVSGVEEVHNLLRVRRPDTMSTSDRGLRASSEPQPESPLGNRNFRA